MACNKISKRMFIHSRAVLSNLFSEFQRWNNKTRMSLTSKTKTPNKKNNFIRLLHIRGTRIICTIRLAEAIHISRKFPNDQMDCTSRVCTKNIMEIASRQTFLLYVYLNSQTNQQDVFLRYKTVYSVSVFGPNFPVCHPKFSSTVVGNANIHNIYAE